MCKILTNERKIEIRRNNSPLREINTGIEMCFPCQSGSKALKSAVENPNIKKKNPNICGILETMFANHC